MAKRRAAFLLKQQRKAEEARQRKLQQEAESELKRDEARYFYFSHKGMLLSQREILPVLILHLPLLQGVRQRRSVFVRKRRRRDGS